MSFKKALLVASIAAASLSAHSNDDLSFEIRGGIGNIHAGDGFSSPSDGTSSNQVFSDDISESEFNGDLEFKVNYKNFFAKASRIKRFGMSGVVVTDQNMDVIPGPPDTVIDGTEVDTSEFDRKASRSIAAGYDHAFGDSGWDVTGAINYTGNRGVFDSYGQWEGGSDPDQGVQGVYDKNAHIYSEATKSSQFGLEIGTSFTSGSHKVVLVAKRSMKSDAEGDSSWPAGGDADSTNRGGNGGVAGNIADITRADLSLSYVYQASDRVSVYTSVKYAVDKGTVMDVDNADEVYLELEDSTIQPTVGIVYNF